MAPAESARRRKMGDKRVKLKDGTEVLIRPMRGDDLDRSFAFFKALSKEDRTYLRLDVSKRELVERRIRDMEEGLVRRIVAVAGDRIVGDAALELSGHGWMQHMAELDIRMAITVPGEIISSNAMAVEGRTSIWALNAANMMQAEDTDMDPVIIFASDGLKIEAEKLPE